MRINIYLAALSVLFASGSVSAESGAPVKDVDIEVNASTIKKGAFVAMETCTLCHGFKYLKYRDLAQIGFTPEEIDSVRMERDVDSVVNARFSPEIANKTFGMVPPDLSLIAKANKHGARHPYTILTSYVESPEGKVENQYFPGIRMPDPLGLSVEIDPARKAELDQRALNVSAFLQWISDPRADERKTLGMWVIGYLVLLTVLLYLIKQRVWGRLK